MHGKSDLVLGKFEMVMGAAGIALIKHGTIQAALMAACDAAGIHDSYLTADRLRHQIGWKASKMKHYHSASRIATLVIGGSNE